MRTTAILCAILAFATGAVVGLPTSAVLSKRILPIPIASTPEPSPQEWPRVPTRFRKRDAVNPHLSGSSTDDYIASHSFSSYNQEGERPTLKRRHELKEVKASEQHLVHSKEPLGVY
ncbi:hypothetical protein BGZ68_010047 [Mortierella alpina]|nr:hypothetical protein BGZ68_010047 [Mortierella alpina]